MLPKLSVKKADDNFCGGYCGNCIGYSVGI